MFFYSPYFHCCVLCSFPVFIYLFWFVSFHNFFALDNKFNFNEILLTKIQSHSLLAHKILCYSKSLMPANVCVCVCVNVCLCAIFHKIHTIFRNLLVPTWIFFFHLQMAYTLNHRINTVYVQYISSLSVFYYYHSMYFTKTLLEFLCRCCYGCCLFSVCDGRTHTHSLIHIVQ